LQAVVSTRLTTHASLMLQRRAIALEWVEDTLRLPSIEMDDARDSTLKLAFRRIPQAGDKWLRVVYRMENNHIHVIVTAFFDRNQESGT
jgi:uncharacterized protein YcaQ